jgi:5-methylcytosine-specific restriction endonuclease McrA
MSWVRYDDAFHRHQKVVRVKVHDPGALGLHLLAGVASATTSTPGVVPVRLAIEEVGSRRRALRWAALLVDAGLWHAPGHDCPRCPAIDDGWVIHDYAGPRFPATLRRAAEALRARARRMYSVVGKACERCGATADLTLDHVIPIALGGTNDPDNIAVLCRSCNSRKGARV